MIFKKSIGFLHLWLGLVSGLIVFVISVTGCIYAFQEEIEDITQTYNFVVPKEKVLIPSALKAIAEKQLDSVQARRVAYYGKDRSATVDVSGPKGAYYKISINPYDGSVLHIQNYRKDFFTIVLYLHMYLLLPPKIGGVIVSTATLIFVVMLISGIILWWPKNKNAAKQRFRFKWKDTTKWKRKNYDLHNILGFYMCILGLVLALTGLVWGFDWFARSAYWVTSGAKTMPEYKTPVSDTTLFTKVAEVSMVDQAWYKVVSETPDHKAISVQFPPTKEAPISVYANLEQGTYYKLDCRYFDQHTLKELSVAHYRGRYKDASFADMVQRLNYDIHVGAIGGLAGKILVFCASLIAASLPVTGLIIWLGRRKKRRSESRG